MESAALSNFDADQELERLKQELEEANMTLEAIRTGQVDALLVESDAGPQLFSLNTADQTYRFFIEQMREGAVTLNREGMILFSNSQFAKLVDSPLTRVVGGKLTEFIAPEDIPAYASLEREAWNGTKTGEFHVLQSGSQVPVQLSLTLLGLDADASLSVLVTDLTEQKNTENKLKENNEKLSRINTELEISNHDLQQFASVASHDLQEPVRKIQIFSKMLRDNEPNLSPTGTVHIEKVISSANRMKMLIVDILNYSGLSANDGRLESVSLAEMISSLLEDFEMVIAEKKAVVTVDALPQIQANAGQIRQVFQNLLSNALKFVRQGILPEIRIGCRRISSLSFGSTQSDAGLYRLFWVADNGIGFEAEYAQNIFSLFERLNGKDKFEGTGIGLAIAKKIVEKHGGIIQAQSRSGEGSVFSFILPVNPDDR